jgi:hypothetical protein
MATVAYWAETHLAGPKLQPLVAYGGRVAASGRAPRAWRAVTVASAHGMTWNSMTRQRLIGYKVITLAILRDPTTSRNT